MAGMFGSHFCFEAASYFRRPSINVVQCQRSVPDGMAAVVLSVLPRSRLLQTMLYSYICAWQNRRDLTRVSVAHGFENKSRPKRSVDRLRPRIDGRTGD